LLLIRFFLREGLAGSSLDRRADPGGATLTEARSNSRREWFPTGVRERSGLMKKNIDVARAWRDQDYYLSLTEEERASLGAHPAGATNVADDVLRTITGGCGTTYGTPACTPCGNYYCGA
jgi:mersacidin/lichenicidin family type 2 lantibiotic